MTTFTLTGRWGASEPAKEGPIGPTLAGRRFALATNPKLDLFSGMLEKRGAQVVRVPLWTHWPAASDPRAQQWVQAIIQGGVQDVVWLSPEGPAGATRVAAGLDQDWALLKAMRQCRHFARGRMTAIALQRMGIICTDFTREVDDEAFNHVLARHRVTRRPVALQVHHPARDEAVRAQLHWLRCEVQEAAVYQLPAGRQSRQVGKLVALLIRRDVDGLIISEISELSRLFAVATLMKKRKALREAIEATTLATFSPRVADELAHAGLPADVVPRRTFALRQLVGQLEQRIGRRLSAC